MSKSREELDDQRRKGFVTGLAVSELMLLILFALLLFMAEGLVREALDRELIESFGDREVARDIGQAIGESPQIQRILREQPDIIDLWISLTAAGALESAAENGDLISELSAALNESEANSSILSDEVNQLRGELGELNESLMAANRALMEGVRMGGTTLCTYSMPSASNPRPRSMPLGVVLVSNEGVTLLDSGYSGILLIDAYGEPINGAHAENVMSSWNLGSQKSFQEFRQLNDLLVELGDDYATESRQNCRYYFDYYFEDVSADTLDLWNRLNYSGVKLSETRYEELMSNLESSFIVPSQIN